MKTIYDVFPDYDDFDAESQKTLQSIFKNRSNFKFDSKDELLYKNKEAEKDVFGEIITNKSIKETSNEIALNSSFGKKSVFYKVEREILKGEIPKL